MRILAILLASTAILAAGCSGDQRSTTSSPSVSSTAPTGSGAVPPGGLVSATVLSDPADVKAVQNRLQQLNFYGGEITGLWTTDTEWAVRNFQQAKGLPAGRLDQPTLRAMGLTATSTGGFRMSDVTNYNPPPPQAAAPPPPPVANIAPAAGPRASAGVGMTGQNLDKASVRQVQTKLASDGYYKIPVDGIWGPKSQDALLQFQDNRNLQVSGRLTPETTSAMGLDHSSLKWKTAPRAPR